ncbi:conserved hypothetical protein [Photorhabdus asymbiotica]|uniref:Uncharacterized protein n=2 Tax=Photorhabdus asymbiotica TaxID=291112 RepID=C7BLL9_PHOAA|nr:conserved hypothetical protein [Photorhabdus asymbiotica]
MPPRCNSKSIGYKIWHILKKIQKHYDFFHFLAFKINAWENCCTNRGRCLSFLKKEIISSIEFCFFKMLASIFNPKISISLKQLNSFFNDFKDQKTAGEQDFLFFILFRISYPLFIPFILQVAALLAAFTHPSHIVIYAPGDSFTCRRAAT